MTERAEKNVSPICIGLDNKDEIRDLKNEIKLLNKDVEHLKSNMVKAEALHELEIKIGTIESKLSEIQGNAKEDRAQIAKLSEALANINCLIEEHLENNAKIIANQMIAEDKNERIEKAITQISRQMEIMNDKIDKSSVVEQLKMFYNKSTLNKWIGRFGIVLLGIFVISVFAFFMSGGSTFFEILNQWKELVM